MVISKNEKFKKDLAYGKFAEIKIAEFMRKKGWNVEFSEDYGIFDAESETGGPFLVILPRRYDDPDDIDILDTFYISVSAPDLKLNKNGEERYIDVKRRSCINTFQGREFFSIKKKAFDDYVELNNNFGNVSVFFYVSPDEYTRPDIYWQTVSFLEQKKLYSDKYFYSFLVSRFKKFTDFDF